MATSVVDEWTEKLRSSTFGRDHFGPKVAKPLARWLQNFDEDPEGSVNGSGALDNSVLGATEPVALRASAHATTLTADSPASATEGSPAGAEGTEAQGSEAQGTEADGDETDGEEIGEIDLTPNSPKALLATMKELGRRIKVHNLVVVAAGIAFWGLLAIPAILIATVSIAGLVLDAETVKSQVTENLTSLPDEVREIIGGQLESVSSGPKGGLIFGVVLGIMVALWTASGAMAKLMGTLNTIYNTEEERKFLKLRGTAIGLTFGGITFISSAIFLLAAMPALLRSIDGVGDSAATLFNLLRFPLLGVVMVIALGVLYHVGPDRSTKYRPLTVGAVVAMVLWIALSGLFTIYTSTVATYNETYGSIGGLVVLLLWLFITAFVVLLGAEIHSQSETKAARKK